MKLNDTYKTLIAVVVTVLIIAGCVMYVILPNKTEIENLSAECDTLQARLTELQAKEAKRDEYLAGIEEYEQAFTEEMGHFAPDLNQEVTIMFLQGIKDNNEFQINSLSLGEPEQFYTLGSNGTDASLEGGDESAEETTEAETADTGSEGEALSEGEAAADSNSYVCYRADFPITYRGSYESLKDVVSYVDNFEDRMTINTVDINYNADADSYEGNIDLMCYAITGPDRPETAMELNDVEIGADNIFVGTASSSASGESQSGLTKYDENQGASIESSYDFYTMLNPSTSDVSAKVVGQNGAGKDASVISNSDNNVSTLNYEFYEKDGKTYCKYTLDNSTSYEAEVTSAEDIKLLIQSSSRKDADDKVGVKVSIRNTSSLPVYVKVSGDDSISPRVDITSKSGAVKVY